MSRHQAAGSSTQDVDTALIAVMGPTGCGKTTFINEASGSSLKVGGQLTSCTSEIALSLPFLVTLPGKSKRPQRVTLIDTPGFDDTTRSDLEILKMIAIHLEKTYDTPEKRKLTGVVYMQRISDPRMGGTYTRNARMFRKLCGHISMSNVVIATTFWSKVDMKDGESREQDLKLDVFFGRSLKKGAIMMRQDGGKKTAHEILALILTKSPEALRIQKQMVDKRRALSNTDASQELYRVLKEQLRQFQEEMDDLDEELQEAQASANSSTIREIEEDAKAIKAKIASRKRDQGSIRTFKAWLHSL